MSVEKHTHEDEKIELPGLKIPLNRWFVVAIFILAVLTFALQKYTAGGVASVVSAGFLGNTGHQEDSEIFCFWTPAVETWEKASDKETLEKLGRASWYQTTNETLDSFAAAITDPSMAAQGYSRTMSYGSGTSGPK